MMDGLVSIIAPVYNSEQYLAEAVESVLRQTYANWELFLVDDCSLDASASIAQKYVGQDDRIHYIKLAENSGAAVARNVGLDHAQGAFVAYLDADDLWFAEKLEKQVAFLSDNNLQFSCCAYNKIEADGTELDKIIYMPDTITYNQLLRNTIIQTVGVIVNLNLVDKKLLVMPNVRRGQDSATWLQMLRNGVVFTGQHEVLASYRRTPKSLSSNKLSAAKRTWYLYRGVEQLSLAKSCFCLVGWAYHASMKRMFLRKKQNTSDDMPETINV